MRVNIDETIIGLVLEARAIEIQFAHDEKCPTAALAWQINAIRGLALVARVKSPSERQFAGETRFIDAFPFGTRSARTAGGAAR